MLYMRGAIPSLLHTFIFKAKYISTVKNEAVGSSETLIRIYQTIRLEARASHENTLQI
jgi:hypothetical protein